MGGSPFDPVFEQLPRELPVFPLTGVLLLPRGRLPLNIFEPRYLAMTSDALGSGRMIGMVQPQPGQPDERQPDSQPSIYQTGCAGRITSFNETDDGRFLITLAGVARFRVASELPVSRGYRRVVPDWTPFRADLEPDQGELPDRIRLVERLKPFFKLHGISADWETIEATPDERLVTTIAMICPFEPSEKQALLEAPNLPERARMLRALVEMATHEHGSDGESPPRH